MQRVSSFHSSAVRPRQLNDITADYLALEGARIVRRLLVKRFTVLAAIFAGARYVGLPAFASWFSVGVCVAAPAWAWIVELTYERRLARRIDELPGAPHKKVVKSS